MPSRKPALVVAAGLGLVIAGLVADVVMHTADPMLAAAEGPLDLRNPAHLLGLLGLVVAVVGAWRLLMRPHGGR